MVSRSGIIGKKFSKSGESGKSDLKKNSDYIALVPYIIIGLLDFEKKLETLSEC